MKKKKKNRNFHSKTIDALVSRLYQEDRIILREHKFESNGDHEADILVLDSIKRYAYAIEVKTTNKTGACIKAYKQLRADKRYLQKDLKVKRVFCFYAYRKNKFNDYTIKRVIQ